MTKRKSTRRPKSQGLHSESYVGHVPNYCIQRTPVDVQAVQYHDGRTAIALLKSRKWPNGSEIPIYLQSPTAQQRRDVQEVMERYNSIVNLNLLLVTSAARSKVRVTFNSRGGAWSYIGTDVLRQPTNAATMNLGFNQAGTYLHEFGHTLGAIHEHQRVDPRYWNKTAVYRDLSGPPNNWDRATIDSNMFERYAEDQLNGTRLDGRSVMMYGIPRTWLLDTWEGWHEGPNPDLSELDISWLKTQYPKDNDPTDPTVPTPPGDNAVTVPVHDLSPYGASIGEANERDLYKFDVLQGKSGRHVIEVVGGLSVNLQLFGPNSANTLLAQTNNVAMQGNAQIDRELTPGAYFVQVSSTERGTYSLVVVYPDSTTAYDKRNGATVRGIVEFPSAINSGRYTIVDGV